jgi:hypothetical protein
MSWRCRSPLATRKKNARRTATKIARFIFQKTLSEKMWRACSLDLLDLIRAMSQTRHGRNHHKQKIRIGPLSVLLDEVD